MKKVCFKHLFCSLVSLGIVLSSPSTGMAQQFSSGPHGAHHIASASIDLSLANWGNLEAAGNDDNSNAARSEILSLGQSTQSLVFQNFNLAIPARATITGIEVVVIRKSTLPDGIQDQRVQLLKRQAFTGQSLSFTDAWDDQWTAAFYGGESNLWGGTWTPAELNGSDFGISIEAKAAVQGAQADVDEVNITVHYTLGKKNSLVSFSGITCQSTAFRP